MPNISEILPYEQMELRLNKCRKLCLENIPQAGGILIFSPLNIYYFTGTLARGILYIPIEGEPILMLKSNLQRDKERTFSGDLERTVTGDKESVVAGDIERVAERDLERAKVGDLERAKVESPLKNIHSFTEYAEISNICKEYNAGLSPIVAAEMSGLSWSDAKKLQSALPHIKFIVADRIPLACREIKSEWELNKMRLAGQRHHDVLYNIVPSLIHAGMNEREISIIVFKEFFKQGHAGMNRMGNFGEDCFLGHIAAGENGNYPSHFNGPLGLKGVHPASPFMGNIASIWEKNSILGIDAGFVLEGYHTDKTQVYWSGTPSSFPDKLKKAQDVCLEIQNTAAQSLKIGAIPSQIWSDSCAMAKKYGMEEGFMGLGDNKVKFLGHGIGLVIDESPVIAHKFDSPVMENMVMAIEPKIGIKGYGMLGVENTFEITGEGAKSITGHEFDVIFI